MCARVGGIRWVSIFLGLLAANTSCLDVQSTRCSWGLICPPGKVCDEATGQCVFPGEPVCGDGVREGMEACDDGTENSDTEPDACRRDCTEARCGDGVVDSGEVCDDGNTLSGDGCRSDCASDESCGNGLLDQVAGELCDCGTDPETVPAGCNGLNSDDPGAVCTSDCLLRFCGNGIREVLEQCDGTDLGGLDCTDAGYYGGTLGCTPLCFLDHDACEGRCGDGILNGNEACDGSDLGGASCADAGFNHGDVICTPSCLLDFSGCTGYCGDLVAELPEDCDATDLAGMTCQDLGFQGGSLSCLASCSFDTSSCHLCGNGMLDPSEACDGTDLGSAACTDFGFDAGELLCTSSCTLDTRLCHRCGNDICEVGEPASCPTDCSVSPIASLFGSTCALKPDGSVWCWGSDFGLTATAVPVLDDAVELAAAGSEYLALRADGTVWSWSVSANPTISPLPGLTNIVSITASAGHACAIQSGGALYCWGDNSFGQLGDGTTTASPNQPVLVQGLVDVSRVSAGGSHTCAVTQSGDVWCWGYNGCGQLGDGTTTDHLLPVRLLGIASATSVAAGALHSCASRTDGAVYCWGNNDHGQLGTGSSSPWPVAAQTVGTALSVAVGQYHSCAVMFDGSLQCWGGNNQGEIGDGTRDHQRRWPVTVSSVAGVVAVALNRVGPNVNCGTTIGFPFHTCALDSMGNAWCWGNNGSGQLGTGVRSMSRVPVPVTGLANVTHVSVSPRILGSSYRAHACAALSDGTVWCWGDNRWGQLGDGTDVEKHAPVQVSGVSDASDVTTGNLHTCVLRADQTAWCWGANSYGQLGNGTAIDATTPVMVAGTSTYQQIAAGGSWPYAHTCGVSSAGVVWCWGANSSGQLGDGTMTNRHEPTPVIGLPAVRAVAPGALHTCAIDESESVWCWGDNAHGQLGDGTQTGSTTPIQVPSLTGVARVSAGRDHTCAGLTDGSIWCWGSNYAGQLGTGNTTDSAVPIQTSLALPVVLDDLGLLHSCVHEPSGLAAYCWGYNWQGQLGNGSDTTTFPYPTTVTGLSGVDSISAGGISSCAVLVDGSVWCWGGGSYGQLGNPAYSDQLTPVAVVGF